MSFTGSRTAEVNAAPCVDYTLQMLAQSRLVEGAIRGERRQGHAKTDGCVLFACCYSARIPASLMTFPMRVISDFIFAANCSGELPTTSTPELKSRSFTSGLLSTLRTSWFSRLMM